MQRKSVQIACALAFILSCAQGLYSENNPNAISLAGKWRFALDRQDKGISEQWYVQKLPERIRLPGSLQAQGYGDDVSDTTKWVARLYDPLWYIREEYKPYTSPGRVRTPFILQPDKHYVGAAWYQRDVIIPEEWKGRRVVLELERAHWQTHVWLDQSDKGICDAMGTPHEYDLGVIEPGRHHITLRVDNRMIVEIGWDAHSMTDQTQSDWNGIIGKIELKCTALVWLEDVQAFPNAAEKSVLIKVHIGNATGKKGEGRLSIAGKTVPVSWDETTGSAEIDIPLGDAAKTWDEFHPNLTRLTVRLESDAGIDERQVLFGLRNMGIEGTQFTLNNRRIFLRGTHEGCSFPLTGYPPTDVDSWKRIFRICRNHGLNHMRFHSWCPPEAAFVAADELGFFLQPECSIWARDGVRIDPGNKTEAWLYEESRRMMKAYGNHPSFILLSHGNEPEGRWTEALPRWVEYWKERDGRRLYAACTGVAMRPELGPSSGTQYLIVGRIGSNPARGTAGWNGKDYRTTIQGVNVPIITHELGQHAVYPNFDEMKKYTGLFKPRNFEFFRQSLEDHGMLNRYREFVAATGRLQVLGYKEDVEACLRTPGLAGFQLLDLHDYPGQGTSLIGVLDAFWDRKAYTHPEEYRRFCDTTVVLARLNSRTLTQKQTLIIKVETAHSGEAAIAGAVAAWRILDKNNNTAASGEMPPQSIPFGTGNPLGTIDVDLSRFAAPQQYRLVIGLKNTNIENDWNFWVYPDSTDLGPADGILLASSFDRNVLDVLEKGGKVLLCPLSSRLAWDSPPFNFAPIFWNRQLFPKWDRSMGLRCDPKHPALAGFPTDYSSDWQWESLIRPGCRAISLENLPKSLEPIVRSIDDYNRNERQGLVFECKVGKGSLLVCAFDLEADAPVLPAKRQFKASLLKYMRSPLFRPSVQVLPAQIASLFFDNGIMALLGTKASADAEAPMNPVQNLIDGNPTTAWLTPSRGGVKGFPHEVILTLEQSVSVAGFVCMAQQRDRKRIGEVKDYVVCLRTGSGEWKEAKRGVLKAAFSPQRVLLDRPMKTDGIKFTALSSHDGGPVAAMAEFALIMEEGLLKPSEEKTQDKKKEKGVHPDEIDGNTGGPSTQ